MTYFELFQRLGQKVISNVERFKRFEVDIIDKIELDDIMSALGIESETNLHVVEDRIDNFVVALGKFLHDEELLPENLCLYFKVDYSDTEVEFLLKECV